MMNIALRVSLVCPIWEMMHHSVDAPHTVPRGLVSLMVHPFDLQVKMALEPASCSDVCQYLLGPILNIFLRYRADTISCCTVNENYENNRLKMPTNEVEAELKMMRKESADSLKR